MACCVALVGFLSAYLPWVLVPRLTFIYHYFTAVPFLILALLAAIDWASRQGALARPVYTINRGELAIQLNWAHIAAAAFAVICIILFAVYFPAISGAPTDRSYVQGLAVFESWYFG